MKNETILKKAIEKAVKNGFTLVDPKFNLGCCFNCLIFSHDFAKAFWGGGEKKFGEIVWKSSWQNHLQQMVLEKEPLLYLEKFL